MEALELLDIIERGEDSHHQFKRNVTNAQSLSQEFCAFANSEGGLLIIGIDDRTNEPVGLSTEDIHRINQLVSNAASEVRNPINPISENLKIGDKIVMVVRIREGKDKPYFASDGAIFVKSGADKRKVTSKEELRRLFEDTDFIHGDSIPVDETTLADIDLEYFKEFLSKEYEKQYQEFTESLQLLLNNLNLAKGDRLNMAGLLLFGKNPQKYKPQFNIKAVHFSGKLDTADMYLDSEDFQGKLSDLFNSGMSFIRRNLSKIQNGQNRNSLGVLAVNQDVFEELLVNALIHRSYLISAPIRLFIFTDRIEIINPGTLPNNLTIENIKNGNSNQRNPIIASFATKQHPPLGLPYRGIGTGIRRALSLYSEINFINDKDNNLFKAIIHL